MSLARDIADLGSSATALDKVGSNLIMNGAMLVDQRNSGSAVTPVDGTKTLDRFSTDVTATGKFSVQQVSDGPDGFINSFKVTSLSAYSVSSSDFLDIAQNIEGLNVSHLNLGSSNAKVITLSFYVKSSLTGTFGGSLTNSAYNRSYPYTYTISSANTWERKTITLTGDTSGTWLTTNGVGLRVVWSMGAGSGRINTAGAWVGSLALGATGQTNVVATNAATWQITGVQLELGSTATDFEHRSFGDELARCQRYYTTWSSSGLTDNLYMYTPYASGTPPNTSASVGYTFPVTMRANPTMVGVGLSLNRFTSSIHNAVAQMSSTVSNAAYSLASWTADAEL
tara:strand:- start:527 stop:1546 length:1020 start_codon:yes stop_codon:yes gene_type:complete